MALSIMYSSSLSDFSARFPSSNSIRGGGDLNTNSDGFAYRQDADEDIWRLTGNEEAIVCPSSTAAKKDRGLKRAEEVLSELSAGALQAIPALLEVYSEYQEFLKLRISNCGIPQINSLVAESKSIHDFVDQLGMFQNNTIRPAQVQFLAGVHRDMLRLQARTRARESELIQKLKPIYQPLKDMLQELDEAGLKRIEGEVCRHMEARERAPFIPHLTRCFFLELPRELRDRIFVFRGRLHVEAILFALNSREHYYRDRTRLQHRADLDLSCSLLCVSRQVRAEFQEILYSLDVVVGHIWDDRGPSPRWRNMNRGLLQKCFGRSPFSGQVYSLLPSEFTEVNEASCWPPEMRKIVSSTTQGPWLNGIWRKLCNNDWLLIRTDVDKHMFMSCQRRSSEPFKLWGCEISMPSRDHREHWSFVGNPKLRQSVPTTRRW